MGIALFTLSSFFAPLQAAFNGFMPRSHKPVRVAPGPCVRPVAVAQGTARPLQRRPLRVVRVSEPRMSSTCAGRMVISGSMEDVCAELDRLAALESSQRH